ncbi:MAG: hypothetical protein M9934_14125 [Thermomicrobiales bacterium]|nr:hypothetical protein [Thermomicrobiales bacterium]MCO5229403.1 hypothetical protein [Thermomicrobiales bacterium]
MSITDFFGGQHRHLQLERDQFGDSLAVGPALNGQGVIPWGISGSATIPGSPTLPDKDKPLPHVILRDYLYFTSGATLYKGPGVWEGAPYSCTIVKTYAHPITDICTYGGIGLLICFGNAADIIFWNEATGTETVLFAGERGYYIAPYAGYAIWNDARTGSRPTVIRQVTGGSIETRRIDHDPIAITTADAELFIITKQALYSFSGRVRDVMVNNPAYTVGGSQPPQIPGQEWSGDYTPFYQQGVFTERDDFRVFTGFGGRIMAWIAGGVHELIKTGDRAGWRSTGLTGQRCFGGTVSAGWLIVSIESDSETNDLWAYDGSGWWRLATQHIANGPWCWPMAVGSGSNARNFIIFQHGSSTFRLHRLTMIERNGDRYYPYPDTAYITTSMLDAGERDKVKAWRKVGAVFASPVLIGNTVSGDNVRLYLDYSTDCGTTWVNVYDQWSDAWAGSNGNSLAAMNFAISEALSGVMSRFIMLRVSWTSVLNWAPILTGLWVEYEVMDTPARRRKWQLRIHARDQEVDRDGAVFTRTGRELIAELWQAWQQDTILPFRDIDYDTTPVQRTVRIVGIGETVAHPADSAEWGDATIMLNLVEV